MIQDLINAYRLKGYGNAEIFYRLMVELWLSIPERETRQAEINNHLYA